MAPGEEGLGGGMEERKRVTKGDKRMNMWSRESEGKRRLKMIV